MEREELLKSREYWITQIQMGLFEVINNYMKDNDINQSQFAEELNVNKSYVSQILSGNFDHKISKYIDLLLACKKVPIINFVDLDDYVYDDQCHLKYVLYTAKDNGVKTPDEKATGKKDTELLSKNIINSKQSNPGRNKKTRSSSRSH